MEILFKQGNVQEIQRCIQNGEASRSILELAIEYNFIQIARKLSDYGIYPTMSDLYVACRGKDTQILSWIYYCYCKNNNPDVNKMFSECRYVEIAYWIFRMVEQSHHEVVLELAIKEDNEEIFRAINSKYPFSMYVFDRCILLSKKYHSKKICMALENKLLSLRNEFGQIA